MEQITQYLRDPLWQSIGVFITLGTTFWLTSRNKKMLSYEVISKNQLLSVDEQVAGKLRIFYEDQPTQDLCLLVIKLSNSGNTAISAKDFEEKITLSTGENSKILSVTVIEKIPENLSEKISLFDSYLTIEPLLLNSKDSLSIKLLVSNPTDTNKISVGSRIIGVRQIEYREASNNIQMVIFGFIAYFVGTVMSLISTIEATNHTSKPTSAFEAQAGDIVSSLGVLLALLATINHSGVLKKIRKFMIKLIA
jgi:hypothetical protein